MRSETGHNVRLIELRPEKRGVGALGLRRRRDEALWVEVMVQPHE